MFHKAGLPPRDGRVHDGLEAGHRIGFAQRSGRKSLAIDDAIDDDAGKDRFDEAGAFRSIKVVHGAVRIEHRTSQLGEHSCDSGFSHGDRAGQTHDNHEDLAPFPRISASTKLRSAAVTDGRIPNHRSKPGAAWCNSMPRPPTVRCPRRRASWMREVSKGT